MGESNVLRLSKNAENFWDRFGFEFDETRHEQNIEQNVNQ